MAGKQCRPEKGVGLRHRKQDTHVGSWAFRGCKSDTLIVHKTIKKSCICSMATGTLPSITDLQGLQGDLTVPGVLDIRAAWRLDCALAPFPGRGKVLSRIQSFL